MYRDQAHLANGMLRNRDNPLTGLDTLFRSTRPTFALNPTRILLKLL